MHWDDHYVDLDDNYDNSDEHGGFHSYDYFDDSDDYARPVALKTNPWSLRVFSNTVARLATDIGWSLGWRLNIMTIEHHNDSDWIYPYMKIIDKWDEGEDDDAGDRMDFDGRNTDSGSGDYGVHHLWDADCEVASLVEQGDPINIDQLHLFFQFFSILQSLSLSGNLF